MVVCFRHAFGMTECPAAPVAFVPRRRIAARAVSLGAIAAALPLLRLLAALMGDRRNRRPETTGPGEPPEEPACGDIWSDPAFYMLMIH
jgi:hypothetical protein